MSNVRINLTQLNQIQNKLREAQNKVVVVGLIGQTDSEIIKRGIYTEFGTSKMVGWHWLRRSVQTMKPKYKNLVGRIIAQLLQNRPVNYNLIGIWAQGEVKKKIGTITTPALKPSTIQAKGSSKPLIDTGQMRNSISFEIRRR